MRFLDALANVPRAQKVAAGIVGLLVVAGLGYFLLVSPKVEERSRLRQQNETLQAEVRQASADEANLRPFRRQAEALRNRLQAAKERLPSEKEMPQALPAADRHRGAVGAAARGVRSQASGGRGRRGRSAHRDDVRGQLSPARRLLLPDEPLATHRRPQRLPPGRHRAADRDASRRAHPGDLHLPSGWTRHRRPRREPLRRRSSHRPRAGRPASPGQANENDARWLVWISTVGSLVRWAVAGARPLRRRRARARPRGPPAAAPAGGREGRSETSPASGETQDTGTRPAARAAGLRGRRAVAIPSPGGVAQGEARASTSAPSSWSGSSAAARLLALVEAAGGLGYILKPGDSLGNGHVTDVSAGLGHVRGRRAVCPPRDKRDAETRRELERFSPTCF